MSEFISKSVGLTHIGRVRVENQDAFLSNDEHGFYIVADGLGGLAKGLEAAQFTVKHLAGCLARAIGSAGSAQIDPQSYLKELLIETSNQLPTVIKADSGSTVVVALLIENRVIIANLGDSPAYLFRNNTLRLLSKEHNLAKLWVERGQLTPEQAMVHPARNQLYAFVGFNGEAQVYTNETSLNRGERLLLCTDGLTAMVPEAMISKVLAEESDLKAAAEKLIEMANAAGGYDNITIILIEIS